MTLTTSDHLSNEAGANRAPNLAEAVAAAQVGQWIVIGYSADARQITRLTPQRFYFDVGQDGRTYESYVEKKHVRFVGGGQMAQRLSRDIKTARQRYDEAKAAAAKLHRDEVRHLYTEAWDGERERGE